MGPIGPVLRGSAGHGPRTPRATGVVEAGAGGRKARGRASERDALSRGHRVRDFPRHRLPPGAAAAAVAHDIRCAAAGERALLQCAMQWPPPRVFKGHTFVSRDRGRSIAGVWASGRGSPGRPTTGNAGGTRGPGKRWGRPGAVRARLDLSPQRHILPKGPAGRLPLGEGGGGSWAAPHRPSHPLPAGRGGLGLGLRHDVALARVPPALARHPRRVRAPPVVLRRFIGPSRWSAHPLPPPFRADPPSPHPLRSPIPRAPAPGICIWFGFHSLLCAQPVPRSWNAGAQRPMAVHWHTDTFTGTQITATIPGSQTALQTVIRTMQCSGGGHWVCAVALWVWQAQHDPLVLCRGFDSFAFPPSGRPQQSSHHRHTPTSNLLLRHMSAMEPAIVLRHSVSQIMPNTQAKRPIPMPQERLQWCPL